MELLAGVDVGNSTTEAVVGILEKDGNITFLGSSACRTTGTKGTPANLDGILNAIYTAINKSDLNMQEIQRVVLNHATPVIGDFAIDTITETVITDSTMIGHNPDTPGGEGIGKGITAKIDEELSHNVDYVIVVPSEWGFQKAADYLNELNEKKYSIKGAIVQNDEGTLISNRLWFNIPIVDEVALIEKIPMNMLAAIEVAPVGYYIDVLSNPYGIATLFDLSAEETDYCKHIAKALVGNRSAVVIKTPVGNITERVIPAGEIEIVGELLRKFVNLDAGASEVMGVIDKVGEIADIKGAHGTNIGGMIEQIREKMSSETGVSRTDIRINDLFAADVLMPRRVKGGLANEFSMESGVAIAAMVRSEKAFMSASASLVEERIGAKVTVDGVEGEMALLGALTTPGAKLPAVVVDAGAGSIDAAYMDICGNRKTVHLAGAGNMVTMMIDTELSINDFETAEHVKMYPLAKIESLYRIRHENGDVKFLEKPLDARFYGQTVAVTPNKEMLIIGTAHPMEEIRRIRRDIKQKVLVQNVLRALNKLDCGKIEHVILVGGSFLDFEVAGMLTQELSRKGISAGKGNIRGTEGTRNAVATGLLLSAAKEK